MIRDRMKPIAGGVNFWPHRSLIQFRKVNIVQVLLNKYFVLVFIAYFLLRFCFCFFSGNLKLFSPLILEYVALLDVELTLNRSEFIHVKLTFHSSKHDFFSTSTKDQKNTKAIRIKVLHEGWKKFYFLPINETLTINSPYRTSAWLVESPRTNLVPRAFPLKTHFLREKPWGQGWPRTRKRETSFKSNPGQIPAQSNTRFEIRLMPRLPQHNIWA